jgi:hypothetical protein
MVLGMRRPLGVPFVLGLGGLAWAGVHLVAHRATEAAAPGHALHGHAPGAAEPAYVSTSLSLCLALALVVAAMPGLYPRWRAFSGRALWLFAAVPLLGLFGGAVLDSGGSLAHIEANLVQLLPIAGLVLLVQAAVAVAAVRVARGLIDVVAAVVRGFVGGPATWSPATLRRFFLLDADRARAAEPALDGRPRAPPALALAG